MRSRRRQRIAANRIPTVDPIIVLWDDSLVQSVRFSPRTRCHVFTFPEKAVKATLGVKSAIHDDLQYLFSVVTLQFVLDGSQARVVDTIIEVHTHRLIDDLRQDMWTDFQPFGGGFI